MFYPSLLFFFFFIYNLTSLLLVLKTSILFFFSHFTFSLLSLLSFILFYSLFIRIDLFRILFQFFSSIFFLFISFHFRIFIYSILPLFTLSIFSSFATHACILTRMASTAGSPRRFTRHTTLPYPRTDLDTTRMPGKTVHAAASAVRLSPATLSARNHLTSELLRTLSRVAASKPTSWLSMRLHILFHLAHA